MRELINTHIREASLHRTAPVIAERAEQRGDAKSVSADKAELRGEQKPVTFIKAPLAAHPDPMPTAASAKASGNATAGANDPIQPLLVKTITYRTAPVQTAPLAPMPALVPAAAPLPQPTAAAATSARPPAAPLPEASNTVVVASVEPATIATAAKAEPVESEAAKPDMPRIDVAKAEPSPAQIRARGGWLIQIGAYEGEDEARQHLSEAKLKISSILAAADPFTERVQKGDRALYRARFPDSTRPWRKPRAGNSNAATSPASRSGIRACSRPPHPGFRRGHANKPYPAQPGDETGRQSRTGSHAKDFFGTSQRWRRSSTSLAC